MIKHTVKNLIGNHYSTFDYPILVNSYGRSGSTVLTKSIINSAVKVKNDKVYDIAARSIFQRAWDLEKADLKDGIVYKTHDYPPKEDFKNEVRILYTFADPVNVVLSLLRLHDERGEKWMREHYDHLKVPFTNFQGIVREDQLNLENHLDSWIEEKRFPIAFIKYEAMWEHQKEISNFLDFDIQLPPFRKRKAKDKKNESIAEELKTNYSSLADKVNKLDPFFTNEQINQLNLK